MPSQNVERKSVKYSLIVPVRAIFFFLANFDVICDLLLMMMVMMTIAMMLLMMMIK